MLAKGYLGCAGSFFMITELVIDGGTVILLGSLAPELL